MYQHLALYINGQFLDGQGRQTQAVINPANGSTLGQLPLASQADLDAALNAAQDAFKSWRHSSPMDRSAILRKVAELSRERAQEIGRNLTLDQGKPLAEAVGEIMSCADHADWHAEECRRIYGRVIPARNPKVQQMVLREPIGVCAAFTPWNFPYNQAIRKICAAIGAGCTIILKGPEDSPSAVMAIAQAFHDAGLPPGVLNIVWGVPQEVSDYLIRSPIVRKVSFTGSVPVGKQLAALAGAHMKRITMELGGHSPVLVLPDADVARAARQLARFKIRNAGQVCISPTRFYIHDDIYTAFVDRFTEELANVKVGDGLDPDTQMGPLAHERRLPMMQKFVDNARSLGGKVLLGGEQIKRDGFFFSPTVLTDLPDDALVMTEEPFGPIAPLTRYSELDDAIARANSLPYGLSAYAFTQSLQDAHRLGTELESGMVNINHFGSSLPETPFGGVKDSGIGSEGGAETFDGYLVTKFVTQI
ncbi:NAD-dependent succinate-semialdehyde dehydrogenase [Alcaligenes faecalis]|jgi:succinate-semialdehyde dehydrogenase/glutarate-semialdehyde dehydrogenase|uniref:NAD-dependent succinate-semialdehyde dehydrogenase n=1 Tax=Alcaligenes nematophilus TaxID=2994643 RepID=A0ABU3MXR6_9BURK|nr:MULTISPECIES: NAD-dependent succinate-semialdehyde dehydrogenase [Alcaligenes]MDK7585779.1 NAD-dependent succinate-semialdehyde dehydrogenase [Alcaligenes phenolicus]KVX04876.1 NAD-dependent succinate-semialdehyde dehydrogenase [Alcaligenes faecalis]MCM2559942.1 NAD-dependent succinate-semialdehyde dehydrogenase [Alcaligenes faecalis]MCM2622791.1 NAD-dependent succinate-semialdehyde dehydrogenase [Alcaligenes faecalis]MDT8465655.1 NAD-dependent succinate-semialdehyde dehydrogenase [Alcalige